MMRLLAVCLVPAVLGFGSFSDEPLPTAADAEFYCDTAATISDGDGLVQDGGDAGMSSHEWCGNADECKDYPKEIVGGTFGGASCDGVDDTLALACDGMDFGISMAPLAEAMLKHFCPATCGGCEDYCADKPDLLVNNNQLSGGSSPLTCEDAVYPSEYMMTDTQDVMTDPTCADDDAYTDAQGFGCAGWTNTCTLQVAVSFEYTEAEFNDIVANCPGTCTNDDYTDAQGFGCADWTGSCTLQVAVSFDYTEAEFNDIVANCPGTCCGTVPAVDESDEPVYVHEKTGKHCAVGSTDPPSGPTPAYKCDESSTISPCETLVRMGCTKMSGICEPCPYEGRRRRMATLMSSVPKGGFKLTSK